MALLRSLRGVFGDQGMEALIAHREKASIADYRKLVGPQRSLRQKLTALARIRSREGYMASVTAEPGGSFLLVENHCPICAAATACQGLCRSELAVFRAVLGTEIVIERIDQPGQHLEVSVANQQLVNGVFYDLASDGIALEPAKLQFC